MRALGPAAVTVKRERMLLELEALLSCDLLLPLLDLGVIKLLDPAALQANQVVVMLAFVEFEHRFARLEIAALEQTGLLELRQDAIDRCQPDILPFGQQLLVDVLGTHVPMRAVLEDVEDLQTRHRGLETGAFQFR